MESHIRLPAQRGVCFSLCPSPCSLSLSEKKRKEKGPMDGAPFVNVSSSPEWKEYNI